MHFRKKQNEKHDQIRGYEYKSRSVIVRSFFERYKQPLSPLKLHNLIYT